MSLLPLRPIMIFGRGLKKNIQLPTALIELYERERINRKAKAKAKK